MRHLSKITLMLKKCVNLSFIQFFRYILNLDYNIYEYNFVVGLNWKKSISSVILHFEIFKFDLKLIQHNAKQD